MGLGFLDIKGGGRGARVKKESPDFRCPGVCIINTSDLSLNPSSPPPPPRLPGPLKLDSCKCCGYAYQIILVTKNIVDMIKLNKVNYTWCNFTSPCLMLFKLQYEVQVLRSLSHPNILPFYCSFVTQQEVWHVLPLMQFGMFLPYDYTCTFFKSI